MSTSSKIIVVSNRLPFVLKKNDLTQKWERHASAGGLVTALAPIVIKNNGIWIGWPGVHLKENVTIPDPDENDTTPTAGLRSDKVVQVNFDRKTYDNYYNDCCNGTFWPLFHSMIKKTHFSAKSWKTYCLVNEEFAKRTVTALEKLSTEEKYGVPIIWIHDYHLMLAANIIRQAAEEKHLKYKLGFFLHIPFPPLDIIRLFPWADKILQGILGCDMIGFHTKDYCINFMDCCHRLLDCHVDGKNLLVKIDDRIVQIHSMPIGIPFETFEKIAKTSPRVLRSPLKTVLGVERLDYTKGLINRLNAFELLLERYPEHLEKVILVQICVPSRTGVKEYQDLKTEIDRLVGRINGRFTTINWIPINYIYNCISQNDLAAIYRDSDVAIVSSLRDGMNLVAKEFVACQVTKSPGVLIISPFAGASETMQEALISNPYDLAKTAENLHKALTMCEVEKIQRMKCLRHKVKLYDVNYWTRYFFNAMDTIKTNVKDDVLSLAIQPVTVYNFEEFLLECIRNHRRSQMSISCKA